MTGTVRTVGVAAWGILLPWLGHAQGVVLGAGYSTPRPIDVAPGQVITVFVRIPDKTLADAVTATPPLPALLGGFSVVLRQTFSDPRDVPIVSVSDFQSCSNLTPFQCEIDSMVTVQVPYELTPNVPRTTVPANSARLEINYNGNPVSSLFINPVPDRIHVLNSCDVAANLPLGSCLPLVTRPDGSLVARDNPAEPGEELTVALVGLGWTVDPVTTGAATPSPAPLVSDVFITLDAHTNASPDLPGAASDPANANLRVGSVGIYEVKFTVPPLPDDSVGCSSSIRSNLTVSVGRTTSFDGAGICVDVAAH